MNLGNSALTHRAGKLADDADVSVRLTRAALNAITLKQHSFADSIADGDIVISGNPAKLRELFGLLEDFTPDFEIVEPIKADVE
jgi:alkyl sulfatase BDS1-like metallo-beta-lactamase superfamily hydrolase